MDNKVGRSQLMKPGFSSRIAKPSGLPKPAPIKRKMSEEEVPSPVKKKSKVEARSLKPLTVPGGGRVLKKSTISASRKPLSTNTSSNRPLKSATAAAHKIKPKTNITAKGPTTKSSTAPKKARPAWDTKGQLEDAKQDIKALIIEKEQLQKELNSARNDVECGSGVLNEKNTEISGLQDEREQLQAKISGLQETLKRSEDSNRCLTDEVKNLKSEVKSGLDALNTKCDEIAELADEGKKLQSKISELQNTLKNSEDCNRCLTGEVKTLKNEVKSGLDAFNGKCAELQSERNKFEAKISNLEETLASSEDNNRSLAEEIQKLNAKLREEEMSRRRLHNVIQELKGNIRVFCRVRPLLGEETTGMPDNSIPHMKFPDKDHRVLLLEKLHEASQNETLSSCRSDNKYEFKFDKVFEPDHSQSFVFEEISQLIQSCLDGYNTCIFAYGQTGSGKTYTMEGPDNPDEESQGMIPRAVDQVFQTSKNLEKHGWNYDFEASFVEIYNESIRDLLSNSKDQQKHDIRMDSKNKKEIIVTNLTTVKVTAASEIHKLLKQAGKNRAVAETKCNERSSRSHSVFRLKISGANHITSDNCTAMLNLVDLAGSEKLKQSASEGQRLKETQAINKSLSNLGNVIMALANKSPHIPYRDSKLTHLLQSSLGGNSKTLMFVNVSPRDDNLPETLNSLRFATKVNNCNIGTAQKNMKKT